MSCETKIDIFSSLRSVNLFSLESGWKLKNLLPLATKVSMKNATERKQLSFVSLTNMYLSFQSLSHTSLKVTQK